MAGNSISKFTMDNPGDLEIHKKIDAYIKGQLNEEEIQDLWHEFARRPQLLDDLEIEVGLKRILQQKAKEKRTAPVFTLSKYTWYVAAAAVLVIVAMLQFFRVDTPTEIESFVVNSISPEYIETADGIRAKDMTISAADSLLNLGFEAVASGNQSRALQLYTEVINDYAEKPYLSKAYLNTGIIHYNNGEYEQAISAFREVTKHSQEKQMLTEKAYWYLGNALANTGQLEEARRAVYETYIMEGIFREPAFKLLQKLNNDLGRYDYNFEEPENDDSQDDN